MQIFDLLCWAYFIQLLTFIFFRWFFVSYFFRFVTLYTHEKHEHSYSYGNKIFLVECIRCSWYFWKIYTSVSICNHCFDWIKFNFSITWLFSSRVKFVNLSMFSLFLLGTYLILYEGIVSWMTLVFMFNKETQFLLSPIKLF